MSVKVVNSDTPPIVSKDADVDLTKSPITPREVFDAVGKIMKLAEPIYVAQLTGEKPTKDQAEKFYEETLVTVMSLADKLVTRFESLEKKHDEEIAERKANDEKTQKAYQKNFDDLKKTLNQINPEGLSSYSSYRWCVIL